jgi:hypothetical protein
MKGKRKSSPKAKRGKQIGGITHSRQVIRARIADGHKDKHKAKHYNPDTEQEQDQNKKSTGNGKKKASYLIKEEQQTQTYAA